MISVFGKRLAGTTSLASAGSTSTGTSRISTVWPPLWVGPYPSPVSSVGNFLISRFLQNSPGQARWANVGATPPATFMSTFLNVSTAQRIGPPSPTSSTPGLTWPASIQSSRRPAPTFSGNRSTTTALAPIRNTTIPVDMAPALITITPVAMVDNFTSTICITRL